MWIGWARCPSYISAISSAGYPTVHIAHAHPSHTTAIDPSARGIPVPWQCTVVCGNPRQRTTLHAMLPVLHRQLRFCAVSCSRDMSHHVGHHRASTQAVRAAEHTLVHTHTHTHISLMCTMRAPFSMLWLSNGVPSAVFVTHKLPPRMPPPLTSHHERTAARSLRLSKG